MELKELYEKTCKLFGVENSDDIAPELMKSCLEQNSRIEQFAELIDYDFSVDWIQKIFQYYQADRKEKMQDYTPKSLAEFVAKLAGDSETTVDMCAGSGALTIQACRQNPDAEFQLYEFDENVIPYLLFNLVLRNIKATVFHSDVLQQTIFHKYKILKGEKFGILKEVQA